MKKTYSHELLEHGVYALEQQGMFIDIGTPEDYMRAQALCESLYQAAVSRITSRAQRSWVPLAGAFEKETKSMIITRTPLRISFFGGGTDYPIWYREFGGAVLSTAIDKCCYITCRRLPPFFEYHSRLSYSRIENVNDNRAIEHPSARGCLQYMGVDEGVEIHHVADLPARTGLGTSSAFHCRAFVEFVCLERSDAQQAGTRCRCHPCGAGSGQRGGWIARPD